MDSSTSDPAVTYFGLAVVAGRFVRLADIERLPFAAFWRESAAGSAQLDRDGETLVYLHDWESFSRLFIRTGQHRFSRSTA